MAGIHITALQKLLNSGTPVDIRLWTKKGEIQHYHNCVSLRYDFYRGTRRIKLLDSREIRTVRDCLIFEINNTTVYL